MSQPPIVPGRPPEEPPPYHPLPPPMYYPPRPPSSTADVVNKTAVGTITVIAIIVGLVCVLPMLICGGMAILGGYSPGGN